MLGKPARNYAMRLSVRPGRLGPKANATEIIWRTGIFALSRLPYGTPSSTHEHRDIHAGCELSLPRDSPSSSDESALLGLKPSSARIRTAVPEPFQRGPHPAHWVIEPTLRRYLLTAFSGPPRPQISGQAKGSRLVSCRASPRLRSCQGAGSRPACTTCVQV